MTKLKLTNIKFDGTGRAQGWADWQVGEATFKVMFIASPDGTITSMADCANPAQFRGEEFKSALREAIGLSRSAH